MTKEVWALRAAIRRCTKPKDKAFPRYGGAGISVHPRYLGANGVSNLIADIGPRPKGKFYLDRIRNAEGYVPGNLKWSTATESNRNRTNVHSFEFRGEMLTIQEISDLTSRPYGILHQRLVQYGWSVEDAVSLPSYAKAAYNLPQPTERYLFRGKMLTRAEISRETGIPYSRLDRRLKKGMTADDAVTRPLARRWLVRLGLTEANT